MRRLKPGKCGYQGYSCVGIPTISLQHPFVSDIKVYTQNNGKRPKDNNYLNIPTQFQGVIHSTQFFNLQGVQGSVSTPQCFQKYNPFTPQGLYDYADRLSVVHPMDTFSSTIKQYIVQKQQKPGILRPKPKIHPFRSPESVTIPSSVISAVPRPQVQFPVLQNMLGGSTSGGGVSPQRQSGCDKGFVITVDRRTGSDYVINVSEGQVITRVDSEGKPLLQKVPENTSPQFDLDQIQKVQVWMQIEYSMTSSDAVVNFIYLDATKDEQDEDIKKPWTKRQLLGTVQNAQMLSDVDQTKCSPLDFRDWVSQQQIPTGQGNLFVFYIDTAQNKKGWLPVKDC